MKNEGGRGRKGGKGRRGSACGHAEPRTSRSEARRQRQFALGVGPQRQWKKRGSAWRRDAPRPN